MGGSFIHGIDLHTAKYGISNSNTTELLIKECLIVSQYNYNLKDLETVY